MTMKARIIKRIWIAVLGMIIPAIQVFMTQHHVPADITTSVSGLIALLGSWGLAVWLGEGTSNLQDQLPDYEGTPSGIHSTRTDAALVQAINDPGVSARLDTDGRIRIEKAVPVNEAQLETLARNRNQTGRNAF